MGAWRRSTPRAGASWFRSVAAFVVGGVLAAGLVGVLAVDDAEAPVRTETVDARFLEQWSSWRRTGATFTEHVERRSGDRTVTESPAEVAQRFPDRVVRTGSQVSARLGGQLIGCGPDDSLGDALRCASTGSFDPDQELRLELDGFRDELAGNAPAYRLSDLGGGCFRLRHLIDEFRPAFGDRTDYCFDEATSVLVSEVRVAGDLTITTRRDDIIGRVDDAALALPSPVAGLTPA